MARARVAEAAEVADAAAGGDPTAAASTTADTISSASETFTASPAISVELSAVISARPSSSPVSSGRVCSNSPVEQYCQRRSQPQSGPQQQRARLSSQLRQ